MTYANLEELLADYIPEAKSDAEKDAIERILDSVSAFVDTSCRRSSGYFNPASGTATEKRIRGAGENFLRLPVHVFNSIESVTLNGTLIESTSYYESEKNGWLYYEDDLFGLEDSFYDDAACRTWRDGRIYKVKAKWGYAATPLDLVEAVRQTVVRIWETQKGTLGQITPNGFVIERAMPPFAKEVLDRYKRRQFEI